MQYYFYDASARVTSDEYDRKF